MAPYPSVYEIEEMFSHRGHPSIFETYLADNLDVTVVGQDFHIAGQYRDKKAFHEGIYSRVAAALDQSTIRVEVMRVIGDGESAWAVIESKCTAMSKYGKPYILEFCDMARFDSQGKITQAKEFLDSEHIQSHVSEHEGKVSEGKAKWNM